MQVCAADGKRLCTQQEVHGGVCCHDAGSNPHDRWISNTCRQHEDGTGDKNPSIWTSTLKSTQKVTVTNGNPTSGAGSVAFENDYGDTPGLLCETDAVGTGSGHGVDTAAIARLQNLTHQILGNDAHLDTNTGTVAARPQFALSGFHAN